MPNQIKWKDGSQTVAIAGASVAPTLKALATVTNKLGDAINNANGNLFADWELFVRGATAFGTNSHLELYFLLAPDGTNYEDGSDSVTPNKGPDVVFPVRSVNTQQRVVIRGVPLPTGTFKPLVRNASAQNLTNTDNENILYYRPFTPEIQ